MAITVQSSFSAGELDPALHERTTLKKYSTGLKTARNVTIGKTGRIISRAGRSYFAACGVTDRKSIIHPLSHIDGFIEVGHSFVRLYTMDGTLVGSDTLPFGEDDLDDIQVVDVRSFNNWPDGGQDDSFFDGYVVLIMLQGQYARRMLLDGSESSWSPANSSGTPGFASSGHSIGGTGYNVDYSVSAVVNGEESNDSGGGFGLFGAMGGKLPIASGERNDLIANFSITSLPKGQTLSTAVRELRIYRRPSSGSGYGYIGSTTSFTVDGSGNLVFTFSDIGQEADYSNGPIELNETLDTGLFPSPADFKPRTGVMYQQRLVMAADDRVEISRPVFPDNFYRDFPLSSTSALSLKISGKGNSKILRLLIADGIVAFCNDGVYIHTGVLGPNNLVFDKRGGWVIDYRIPPIEVPGGVLFIDRLTNTVRQLLWSEKNGTYVAPEVSIFSEHLFRENRVVSWAFHGGLTPLLWVVFSDGTFATFTYEDTQEMRAWTRHDSVDGVEYVAATEAGGINLTDSSEGDSNLILVTNKDDSYSIELGVPRLPSSEVLSTNPEADKGPEAAALDSMVSWSHLVNDDLTDDDITLTPLVTGVWDGELTLSVVDDAIFPDPGLGAVGTVMRHFHPIDGSAVDLEVTARASDDSITVQPSAEYPSAYATNPRLYECKAVFTGLDHLDGENVSILADGYVLASPNNDDQNYDTVTPSSGSATLPGGYLGAIVHIGRPYVMDVETLDIDSVEQRPILLESKTVNKLYVKVFNTRGLYVGPEFPDDDGVSGMKPIDDYIVDYDSSNPVIGNRYQAPTTRRVEITLPGDWSSNGRICFRQVDPIHFEILSITPDVDDQRR